MSGDHRLPELRLSRNGIKNHTKQSVLNKFTYALSEYADVKDKFIANLDAMRQRQGISLDSFGGS